MSRLAGLLVIVSVLCLPLAVAAEDTPLDELERAFDDTPPLTLAEHHALIEQLGGRGEAAAPLIRRVAWRVIRDLDPNDNVARRALGHRQFVVRLPEGISRTYAFVAELERATAKRWFAPDESEQLAAAREALVRLRAHVEGLKTNVRLRTADQVRANVMHLAGLRDCVIVTHWADPFLLCYVSEDRVTEYERARGGEVAERFASIESRLKARAPAVLRRAGTHAQRVDVEFRRLFGETLGIKPLMSPFGGRPDIPERFRSFRDGCPLVVLIFETIEAYDRHMGTTERELSVRRYPHTAGHLGWPDAWIYAHDRDMEAQSEVGDAFLGSIVAQQLVHWYARQLARWRVPRSSGGLVSSGLATFVATRALRAASPRADDWVPPQVRAMRKLAAGLKRAGRETSVAPLSVLLRLASGIQAQRWGAQVWHLDPQSVGTIMQYQAYVLMDALWESEAGTHRTMLTKFLREHLLSMSNGGGQTESLFRGAFGIDHAEGYETLQKLFEKHAAALLAEPK